VSVLVFYISGHGFGHASRDIEVINAFGASHPSTRIIIRTAVAKWLFDLTVRVPYELAPGDTDTGVVQHDSLTHDIEETMRRAAAFYGTFEDRVSREAAWLETVGASLVIADIPPLGFAGAARARIPAFALGNFTWDWIYEDYVSVGPSGEGGGDRWIVELIARAYSYAREAWRLPMHGGFESMARVIDVPFIARHSARHPEETRRAFGLPGDRPLILSSFGGYGLGGLPLERVDCLGDYALVVTETTRPGGTADGRPVSPHIFTLQENAVYDTGYRYEDLVRAADVVMTKPGFGIIAECLANETALVYTSRGRFREYPVLVSEMPAFLRCAFIGQEDLFAGRWRSSVDRALAQQAPAERPPTDGVKRVSALIEMALEERAAGSFDRDSEHA
jgi:L-arabinokinase